METSECLKLPKIAGFFEISEAGSPLRLLSGHARKRLKCGLSKSGKNRHTSAPADRGTIVAFGKWGVCDSGHG
jgi:hypothetical protein